MSRRITQAERAAAAAKQRHARAGMHARDDGQEPSPKPRDAATGTPPPGGAPGRKESHRVPGADGSFSARAPSSVEKHGRRVLTKYGEPLVVPMPVPPRLVSVPDEKPPVEQLEPLPDNVDTLDAEGHDMRRIRRIKRDEMDQFLVLISEGFSIRRASEALNKPRLAFQLLLDSDMEFRARYQEAFEASADLLEDVAWSRAQQGGRYRASADRVLLEALRARRPDRYSEKVQVSGPRGGPIKQIVAHVDHAAVLDVLMEGGLVQPGRLSLGEGG